MSVVLKGQNKVPRNCDSIAINRNLIRILGGAYAAITVRTSGEFCVKRDNNKQVQNILSRMGIREPNKPIQIQAIIYMTKVVKEKGVISDVPMEMFGEE